MTSVTQSEPVVVVQVDRDREFFGISMAVLACAHRSVYGSIETDMPKLPLGFQKTPYLDQPAGIIPP
jgi:hypothetical protein